MVDVKGLRELLEKATPGPWTLEPDPGSQTVDVVIPPDPRTGYGDRMCGTEENATLIAAAVNGLPALLDVVEKAEAVDRLAEREGGGDFSTSVEWAEAFGALGSALARLREGETE